MSEPYAEAVDRLSRVPGVRAALVVETAAGVPVLADAADPQAATAVAALAASLFRRGGDASRAAGFGPPVAVDLHGESGHVVIAGAGDVLLVVVAEADAQLGLLRVEAQRAAEALK